MDLFQALVLGLIQGVTEFLPISSSGHLVLARYIFDWPDIPLSYDVLLHGGSLAAIIVYFWPRIKKITRQYLIWILIGSIPAGIAGVLIDPLLEKYFANTVMLIFGWWLTAATLLYADRIKTDSKSGQLNNHKALLIGIFQALALIPSLSRSGSTIAGALNQRLTRQDAFNFSFLLSIPALIGAVVLKIPDISSQSIPSTTLLIGVVTAFASGLASLKILERVVVGAQLKYFAYYCLALSLLVAGMNLPLQK